jgi:cytochrome c oxidase cbb3-type subunit 3
MDGTVTARGARRWRALAWVVAACVALGAGVALAHGIYRDLMDARLLRGWSPDLARDVALLRYSSGRAAPLYLQHCARCHGRDLHGSRALGAPDLTDRDWLFGSGTIGDIEQTILYGIRSGHHRSHSLADMPAFGTSRPYWRYRIDPLSAGEIRDVVQYLLRQQGRGADRDAAARGLQVYAGKGQCYDCHTSDLRGDSYIGAPNLIDDIWLYGDGSPDSIAESITYGRAGSCPAWAGVLSPADVRALAVYIYSRHQ